MNDIPKVVFSKTLSDAEATWPETRVARGDLTTEIAAIKAEPGPDVIVWGASPLAGALAAADLIDEYRILVQPLVLGRGQALIDQLPESRHLDLVEATPFPSGIVVQSTDRSTPERRPVGTVQAQAIMSLDGYVAKQDNQAGQHRRPVVRLAAERRGRDPDPRWGLHRPPHPARTASWKRPPPPRAARCTSPRCSGCTLTPPSVTSMPPTGATTRRPDRRGRYGRPDEALRPQYPPVFELVRNGGP